MTFGGIALRLPHLGWRLQPFPLRVSAGLQGHVCAGVPFLHALNRQSPEAVGVGPRGQVAAVAAERAVEFVEYAVILVQIAQLQFTEERSDLASAPTHCLHHVYTQRSPCAPGGHQISPCNHSLMQILPLPNLTISH